MRFGTIIVDVFSLPPPYLQSVPHLLGSAWVTFIVLGQWVLASLAHRFGWGAPKHDRPAPGRKRMLLSARGLWVADANGYFETSWDQVREVGLWKGRAYLWLDGRRFIVLP